MIDFRYHALSLAAVLLALAVGVLIGVAIGDSNLVSSAKSGIVRELRAEVSSAQAGASKLEEGLAQERALSGDLYPLAVHGLLAGRAIGLVFLGGPSEADDDLAREAITRAGGELTAVVAVREPLELTAIAAHASGTRYAQLARGRLVGAFGRRMGAQLVQGGRLLARVQTPLLSSFDGQPGHLDGVVVARAQPAGLTHARAAAAEFETGLLAGMLEAGASVVGVEQVSTRPSQVAWYQAQDISSVDDLDTLAGRTALAFALAGSRGSWGIKPSADALLPRSSAPPQPPPSTPTPVRTRR